MMEAEPMMYLHGLLENLRQSKNADREQEESSSHNHQEPSVSHYTFVIARSVRNN
jgi:hypothetical protein